MIRRATDPSGLLLIDKPPGLTSHDVVARVRRVLGIKRVGHAGTLDPFASGLLPCCIGRATRLVQYLQLWSKGYVGLIRLGEETPTDDTETATGKPLPPAPPPSILEAGVRRLTGTYRQTPPLFSAKKIGGIPAHRLARQGARLELAPVTVTVHRFRLERHRPGRLRFAARVSSGTYLRTLARDLGRILGTGAHLEVLRRTRIGPLSARQALPVDDAWDRTALLGALIAPESIPLPLPAATLDHRDAGRFLHGQSVPTAHDALAHPGQALRVMDSSGRMIGIGEASAEAAIRPRAVLIDPPEPGTRRE